MTRRTANPKRVHVIVSRAGNQWLASAGRLTASGHNARTACRLIAALIEERYGPVDCTYAFTLPEQLESIVREYRDQVRTLRSLAKSVPEQRVQCIRELLALGLSQEEAARLMGLKRTHLSIVLRRAQWRSPGKVRAGERTRRRG